MPCSATFASTRLDLTGSSWLIHAGDGRAAPVVSALGKAMLLSPAESRKKACANTHLQKLQIIVDAESSRSITRDYGNKSLICRVPSPDNNDILLFGMMFVAQAIIRAEISTGGLLIHGALAEPSTHPGEGILLAGPGSVGKTTASNHLPLPWRSLSDDASLVIRDSKGKYWAHPWPTWSRFFSTPNGNSGPGGKWNVERRIPLRAIFFLCQAEEERINPLSHTPALTYLMETVQQVSRPTSQRLPFEQARTLQEKQLAAAEALVRTVPSYTLHLSLNGTFWENIEETLASDSIASPMHSDQATDSLVAPEEKENTSQSALLDDTILTVSYSGPSMNHTLRYPDLLEVLPYMEKPIQPGDVVYFHSPVEGMKVIHRVVQVAANGIYTRGDNNSANDPYVLHQNDIIGRVTAAWRNDKRRKIAGGFCGIYFGYSGLLKRRVRGLFSFLLHGTYRGLASSGFFRYLLPASFHPRVFEFKQRHLPSILKLMINGHVIGCYDVLRELWVIDRPWRLIIDETKLPVAAGLSSMETPDLNNTALKNKAAEN